MSDKYTTSRRSAPPLPPNPPFQIMLSYLLSASASGFALNPTRDGGAPGETGDRSSAAAGRAAFKDASHDY